MNSHSHLLLIGAGKMGGALLAVWQKQSHYTITVVEKDVSRHAALSRNGTKAIPSIEVLETNPDCVIFAVKPQSMDEVLGSLKGKIGSNVLYLSIAAGKTFSYFEKYLGEVAIVRAMPNTPALIGKGISGLCSNAHVTHEQTKLASSLMEAAGGVVWVQEQGQMDVVTAISGSGPAYVFLFMEALVNAGRQHGLPEAICKQLAIQMIAGSAELARISQEPLANLRQDVTSPGGTTEAALKVMIKNNQFKNLIAEAVTAAVKRAKELG